MKILCIRLYGLWAEVGKGLLSTIISQFKISRHFCCRGTNLVSNRWLALTFVIYIFFTVERWEVGALGYKNSRNVGSVPPRVRSRFCYQFIWICYRFKVCCYQCKLLLMSQEVAITSMLNVCCVVPFSTYPSLRMDYKSIPDVLVG